MILQPHTYKILYNNRNITQDISDHLIALTYTDKVAGEADELEIALEDSDGLWQNDWYPEPLAILSAEIILNDIVLKCGNFCIDEPEFSFGSSGDQVTIRAVSAFFTEKLRTKRSTAHENKTLAEIASNVASRHNLKIQGNIPAISLGRVTQHKKNDLAFLQGLATTYGYAFSIKGGIMVFTDLTTLEGSPNIITIDKSEVIEGSITDKSSETYKKAGVKFHNPADKELVEYDSEEDSNVDSSDSLEIRHKVENKQQAERVAKSQLHLKNSYKQSGTITVPGNPLLVSGVNFEFVGGGKLSGLYHILKSNHSITRDEGYKTSMEVKRVGLVEKSKYISSKQPKATPKISTATVNNRDKIGFTYIK